MTNIINYLSGKKVYITSVFFAIFNLLLVFGYITLTPDQLVAVDGVFIATFGASFRSAINGLQNAIKSQVSKNE